MSEPVYFEEPAVARRLFASKTFAWLWLMLAWRVAGWYGLDRFALPKLGTPWQSGTLFRRKQPDAAPIQAG